MSAAENWTNQPVGTVIWRADIETSRRWISICCQLLRMQRDIAQSKIQGPGSGKAR